MTWREEEGGSMASGKLSVSPPTQSCTKTIRLAYLGGASLASRASEVRENFPLTSPRPLPPVKNRLAREASASLQSHLILKQ